MLGVNVSVSGGTKLGGEVAGPGPGGVRARDMGWAWGGAKQ